MNIVDIRNSLDKTFANLEPDKQAELLLRADLTVLQNERLQLFLSDIPITDISKRHGITRVAVIATLSAAQNKLAILKIDLGM